jgi:hypothetical protein
MFTYILWLVSSAFCAFGFTAILKWLLFVPDERAIAFSFHDHSSHDDELDIILDDDVCLFHWVLDCPCFDEPVAPTYVHDPYEIVLPFRERIEPPDWVDGWVAPQVRWVVKPKVNK